MEDPDHVIIHATYFSVFLWILFWSFLANIVMSSKLNFHFWQTLFTAQINFNLTAETLFTRRQTLIKMKIARD